MKKRSKNSRYSFRWRHLICFIAVVFLILSVYLFIVLFIERIASYYYLTATSATIGFGLLTLFFAIDTAVKKMDEISNKYADNTKDALQKFGEVTSTIDFVYISCVSFSLQESIGVDCFDDNMWQKQKSFIEITTKKYNEYVYEKNINLNKLITENAEKCYGSFFKSKLTNDYNVDLALRINAILSKLEPLAYMYVNDKLTGEVYEKNMKPDILNLYFMYYTLSLANVLERNCDYIELSLFDDLKNVILKK